MVYFREEQKFEWFWTLIWLIPVGLIGAGLYRQIWLGRAFGGYPVSTMLLWPALTVTVVVAIWFNRAKLITEVRADVLWIHFELIWPVRSIPWGQIRRAEAVTYRPIKDFGGWGVRWAARGIVFHAQGNEGVRMELESGERVLVGSQQTRELARAIEERMTQGHTGAG